MALNVTVPAQLVLSPPLDLPLRQNSVNGCFSCARSKTNFAFIHGCCSDHFASVHPDGEEGIHQVHEAVDLASTEGACVYAVAGGAVTSVRTNDLTVSHPGVYEGFASRYVHVTPLVSRGDAVVQGEPIATVQANAAHGDHLHFGLWHWIDDDPAAPSPKTSIPIDPTRLLYHWERSHALDWATVTTIADSVVAELDVAAFGPITEGEFDSAELAVPINPVVEPLAVGCTWRITGDDDLSYLLRLERGSVTVFEERYGAQPAAFPAIDRVGLVTRRSYPVLSVEAGGGLYGLPLHDVANDHLHGAGHHEAILADLLRLAFDRRCEVQLDLRRSTFWAMDGSVDDYLAVVDGVTLG